MYIKIIGPLYDLTDLIHLLAGGSCADASSSILTISPCNVISNCLYKYQSYTSGETL